MSLKAGFAETEITPPPGTRKIGWIKVIVGQRVLDPLFARAAVFESGGVRLCVVQLDTLSVGAADVAEIRRAVEARYGLPGSHLLVAATHNHAGPACCSIGDVEREDGYVAELRARVVSCVGQAVERLEEAELGFGSTPAFDIGYNRRTVMRDGTVKTQCAFTNPDALRLEGPVDPELAVIAARRPGGAWLGALVNFACHPTHHGHDEFFSAGWPGVLAGELKATGVPCPMFINGAQGNIHTQDLTAGGIVPLQGQDLSAVGARGEMAEVGRTAAAHARRALNKMAFRRDVRLSARATKVELPYRRVSDEEARGTIRGAQRFVDPTLYDKHMPALLEKIRRRGSLQAEVQALALDEYACVGIPAELFVELGLQLKERAFPKHALVFGLANGMVGYVPHREAFARGGYETTFCGWSCLAHEAGELLVDAALGLLRG